MQQHEEIIEQVSVQSCEFFIMHANSMKTGHPYLWQTTYSSSKVFYYVALHFLTVLENKVLTPFLTFPNFHHTWSLGFSFDGG